MPLAHAIDARWNAGTGNLEFWDTAENGMIGYWSISENAYIGNIHGDLLGNNWDDLRVAGTTAKSGAGLKAPGFEKFRDDGSGSAGVYGYAFDKAAEEEVFFEIQMPHSYDLGTDLDPHIHWSPRASVGIGSVRWGLEYTIANIDGTFGATTIIYALQAGSGTAYKHQMISFAAIAGAGLTASHMISCRLFRDATHLDDDFDADAYFLEFDIHHMKKRIGTDTYI